MDTGGRYRRAVVALCLLQLSLSVLWWSQGEPSDAHIQVPDWAFYLALMSGPAAVFINGKHFLLNWVWLEMTQLALFAGALRSRRDGKRRGWLLLASAWWVFWGVINCFLGV